MLRFAHGAVEGGKIPAGAPLRPGTRRRRSGRLGLLGAVDQLVRVGVEIVELVRIARRVDELLCGPRRIITIGRDGALGEIFAEHLVVARRAR